MSYVFNTRLPEAISFISKKNFWKNYFFPKVTMFTTEGIFMKILLKMLVFDIFVKNSTFCESCNFVLEWLFCIKLSLMKRATPIQHNIIKRLFISSSDCLIRAENPTLKSYVNSQFSDFFCDARINQAKATQFFFSEI